MIRQDELNRLLNDARKLDKDVMAGIEAAAQEATYSFGKLLQKIHLAPAPDVEHAGSHTGVIVSKFVKDRTPGIVKGYLIGLQSQIAEAQIAATAAEEGIETAVVGLKAAITARKGGEKAAAFSAMAAYVTRTAKAPYTLAADTEKHAEVVRYRVMEAMQHPLKPGEPLFHEVAELGDTPEKQAVIAGYRVATAAIREAQKHAAPGRDP